MGWTAKLMLDRTPFPETPVEMPYLEAATVTVPWVLLICNTEVKIWFHPSLLRKFPTETPVALTTVLL